MTLVWELHADKRRSSLGIRSLSEGTAVKLPPYILIRSLYSEGVGNDKTTSSSSSMMQKSMFLRRSGTLFPMITSDTETPFTLAISFLRYLRPDLIYFR